MKYFAFLSLVFLTLACSNEIDLVADSEEIPVVYGLLNPSDSAYYMRVERVFVDPVTSALTLAQDPDKVYFAPDEITVKVIEVSTGNEYIFDRINGDDEGLVREEGVFVDSPNILYKADAEDFPLVPEQIYRLEITGIQDGQATTSSFVMGEAPFFNLNNILAFRTGSRTTFSWNNRFGTSIYGIDLEFFYDEFNTTTNTNTKKSVVWNVAKNTTDNNVQILGQDFFSFISGAIEKDDDVRRFFTNISVTLTSAGPSVADYVRVGQANLGITSSGEIPVFTNINNGLGLFSYKITNTKDEILLTPATLDSLKQSVDTRDLNFE